MPKPIKTRTYYNFMRVYRAIMGKGYTPETAEEITRRIFDAYEANPAGLPIWEHVRQIVPASDENGEHTPARMEREPQTCYDKMLEDDGGPAAIIPNTSGAIAEESHEETTPDAIRAARVYFVFRSWALPDDITPADLAEIIKENPALIIDNLLATVEMLTQTAQNAPQGPKARPPY